MRQRDRENRIKMRGGWGTETDTDRHRQTGRRTDRRGGKRIVGGLSKNSGLIPASQYPIAETEKSDSERER